MGNVDHLENLFLGQAAIAEACIDILLNLSFGAAQNLSFTSFWKEKIHAQRGK